MKIQPITVFGRFGVRLELRPIIITLYSYLHIVNNSGVLKLHMYPNFYAKFLLFEELTCCQIPNDSYFYDQISTLLMNFGP